jgi:hypothetical protein
VLLAFHTGGAVPDLQIPRRIFPFARSIDALHAIDSHWHGGCTTVARSFGKPAL